MNKRIYVITGIVLLVAAFCGILYLFHLNKLEADRLQAELDKQKGEHDELSERVKSMEKFFDKGDGTYTALVVKHKPEPKADNKTEQKPAEKTPQKNNRKPNQKPAEKAPEKQD